MSETLGVPVRIAASTTFTLPAADGFAIGVTTYAPAQRVRGVVVINAATGVRRRYYDRFATYLVGRDPAVVTYDYRGIGDSAPPRLRGFAASMREWGELDQPAVIAYAAAWQRGVPLMVVGHSVGGQIFGLLPDPTLVSRVLMVAAQHNYWRLWEPRERWKLCVLWTLLMPAATPSTTIASSHRRERLTRSCASTPTPASSIDTCRQSSLVFARSGTSGSSGRPQASTAGLWRLTGSCKCELI